MTLLSRIPKRVYYVQPMLPFVSWQISLEKRYLSAFSHMSDNDPRTMEREKKKQEKKGHSEWNEELASQSEAAVKADQSADRPVKDLQEETKQRLRRKEKEDAEQESGT
ncbi:hypothetical protein BCR43DRAFT_467917 [Syncephalastrum racemosum]|uniref:Uncharacterized protein n=1 Tax=Syncephalastrum racemosum TaxID=13706 RepID=A0A1X2HKJ2_SYNRA|nr:hypothetical protein BCR43DRAFT_467917 [Syncephalastrum racemosum]